jgi:hypothetical protein
LYSGKAKLFTAERRGQRRHADREAGVTILEHSLKSELVREHGDLGAGRDRLDLEFVWD